MTLEQLAAAVGTTNQQISLLELGKRQLTVAWLVRLAEALACHPWAIIEATHEGLAPAELELAERVRKLGTAKRKKLLNFLAELEAAADTPPRAKAS